MADSSKLGRARPPRVVLLGMRCVFTGPVLAALVASPDIDLTAVVLPGVHPAARHAHTDPVLGRIEASGIPLIGVSSRADLTRAPFRTAVEAIGPDAIAVACFPWRLPAWMLALPQRGCLNLHPSVLPAGRGPDPVFWAFRRGLRETGVTLHLMNEVFDAGPVIAQVRVPIPDDATIPSLERTLAETGSRVLLDHLRTAQDDLPSFLPQHEPDAWYAPVPRSDDLTVPTSWDARRAARFITAVTAVYGPLPVLVHATGRRLVVEEVLGIEEGEGNVTPVTVQGDTARIRFANGTVTCRILRHDVSLRLHP